MPYTGRLLLLGVGLVVVLVLSYPPLQERLATIFSPQNASTEVRFDEYRMFPKAVARYPLGIGFKVDPPVPGTDLLGISNLWLNFMYKVGLGGMLLFIAVTWRWWREARPEKGPIRLTRDNAIWLGSTGGILAALVSGLFDHYFSFAVVMIGLFWLLVGINLLEARRLFPERQPQPRAVGYRKLKRQLERGAEPEMLGSAFWLTLATLLGLCLGFAREWLLVASWGAGERSDAFLIALFLPEALRMSLAGGVLSAAALPLFLERQGERRLDWLAAILPALLGIAVALSLLLLAAAPWLVRLLGGPGRDGQRPGRGQLAGPRLVRAGADAPCAIQHPLQAAERFVLAGLGSLLFNLPPVLYLALHGQASQRTTGPGLPARQPADAAGAAAFAMDRGLAWHWRLSGVELGELGGRIAPLLLSNAASQGLALVERLVASLLGEGAVTWVNLARKLMNLPLIALMSLNQVLLGMMSRRQGGERLALLRRGLETASLLTLPAGVGLVAAAPGLVALLLPRQTAGSPLPALLAWFAVPLVFGAWNALLARYAYAAGDTRLPLRCELLGSALNAALLAVLPLIFGLPGIPLAALGGVLCTALLLMRRQALLGALPWAAVATERPGHGARRRPAVPHRRYLAALGLGTVAGCLALLGMALWLRPWRTD